MGQIRVRRNCRRKKLIKTDSLPVFTLTFFFDILHSLHIIYTVRDTSLHPGLSFSMLAKLEICPAHSHLSLSSLPSLLLHAAVDRCTSFCRSFRYCALYFYLGEKWCVGLLFNLTSLTLVVVVGCQPVNRFFGKWSYFCERGAKKKDQPAIDGKGHKNISFSGSLLRDESEWLLLLRLSPKRRKKGDIEGNDISPPPPLTSSSSLLRDDILHHGAAAAPHQQHHRHQDPDQGGGPGPAKKQLPRIKITVVDVPEEREKIRSISDEAYWLLRYLLRLQCTAICTTEDSG